MGYKFLNIEIKTQDEIEIMNCSRQTFFLENIHFKYFKQKKKKINRLRF